MMVCKQCEYFNPIGNLGLCLMSGFTLQKKDHICVEFSEDVNEMTKGYALKLLEKAGRSPARSRINKHISVSQFITLIEVYILQNHSNPIGGYMKRKVYQAITNEKHPTRLQIEEAIKTTP